MPNNSSTGGPIVPNPPPAPAPLEGTALLDAFQETFVGVSGIASDLVRPMYQTEVPNIPDTGTLWMAFTILERPGDTFPVIQHNPTENVGVGADDFQKQERLVVLCSFYDKGQDGSAMGAAAQLRDGLQVPQNMEALGAHQIALAFTDEITPLPTLIKTLWAFRCDLKLYFNRQVSRSYPILNLDSATVDLQQDTIANFEDVINITP